MLKIWAAQVEEDGLSREEEKPGTILEAEGKTLKIRTGDGVLRIKELQLEGKKRMETDAFLRGYRMTPGEILGV